MRKVAIVALTLVVVGLVVVLARRVRAVAVDEAPVREVAHRVEPERAARGQTEPAGVAEHGDRDEPDERDRPASLRGTDVDGELVLDDDGRFVATAGAIRMFDYFMTTLGETDLDGVRRLIAAQARRLVPGHEAEVMALFEQYVAYLGDAQGAARAAAAGGPADPVAQAREQLGRVEDLQRQRFGGDAARLFGDDNALTRAILDRSDVVAREDLSPEERRAQLDAIEARLPPAMRDARARMRAPAEVREQVEALRQRGASAEEIHALRARYFGEEAADRLAELDRRAAR